MPKTRSGFDPQAALRLYGKTVRDLRNNEPAAMVSDGRTTELSTIEDLTQMQFVSIADWPSITVGFIGAHASKGKVLGQGSGWCSLGILSSPPELITAPASKLSATPCAWMFIDFQHASPPHDSLSFMLSYNFHTDSPPVALADATAMERVLAPTAVGAVNSCNPTRVLPSPIK